ncbi:CtaG-like assembly protein [Alkalihalobacillus alcalophilus ATCC 27647 = CGMCC 1.3604]|uniref:CtaG-like assembly protein n=1 Tax=Alkalihalobacillus alcalophilus ATCC 27647 = CGMCC 1.3604 TaxID=1218173 RepID=A0A094WN33_ALKAL|nr:cytochrome c oxidase assembly factor CtaG [Alkalihalobacillus alcalophilus]KGA97378.1 CtaG-like assembly protein [Alkalihalobacillus alcalophilus ATCC 27647 = CGMCC 1.3604]MED1561923.1 cytochrome c oxidase assembly factor CtaG [Alkalihalobacillus alcalophilus]THG90078.1 CtaG-like assembly protein [Alkalihalobacillus alcalophilus ATCC 27647 = CGMCC 1.3604]
MQSLFSTFTWRALWTPELIIGLVLLGLLYWMFITKWSKRFSHSEPVPLRKKVYFVLFLVALYLGWGSPLYIAGHLMLSLHMTQMVLAYIVAVPLLILSIPTWVYEAIIHKITKYRISKPLLFVWNPIMALFLFNGLFSFYHVPFMFDTLMQNPVLHSFYQYGLFFAAFLMWWFMIQPVPSHAYLSDLKRILYIFLNGLLITPACALIIFAPEAMYEVYTNPAIWANAMAYCLPAGATIPYDIFAGPQSFALLETRMDQQLAGVQMKIMQEIIYGITIAYVFKQWLKKEKQQDGELSISDIPSQIRTE